MQTVVIIIHLMIVAVMIGAVLLQKSEGGGLGMGGGAGFMSSRGTANLLTRTTAILAVGFFVTSLFLSWYAGYDRKPSSITVWAIGTGLTPTAGDVEEVHRFIRGQLTDRFKGEGNKIRILYGGSVKPSNAAELMAVANVNGALVGGASLKASDFLAIAAGC